MSSPKAPWTGNFEDLLRESGDLLEQEGLPRPTPSLLRYYQRQGLLGKGERRGREAHFSEEDLSRVLTAKKLVNEGWSLKGATGLVNNSSPSEALGYANFLQSQDSAPALQGAVTAAGFSAGLATPQSASATPTEASLLVRSLMSNAGLAGAAAASPKMRCAIPALFAPSPAPASSAQPPIGGVDIDWARAAQAPAAERQRLMEDLLEALKKLNSLPPTKESP